MNKIIGTVLFFFAIIAIGSALHFGQNEILVGTVLTQEQIDGKDIDNLYLDYEFDRIEFFPKLDRVLFYFDYTTIEEYEAGTYIVIDDFVRVPIDFDKWFSCRDTNTLSECKTHIKELVEDEVRGHKNREKNIVAGFQTSIDNLPAFVKEDFDFSDLEE